MMTTSHSQHHERQHSTALRYVDHTYRDFSRYVDEGGLLIKHKKSTNNFPARLHKILSDKKNSDVITWMPHGRAWKILDKERLISEVIPNYYVCKKYESFSRQLNGWGFKRLHQSGPDYGCYYHECFLRDLPKITCLIRRLAPNLGKSTPFAGGEPNFYKISEKYPLPPTPSLLGSLQSGPPSSSSIIGRMRAASLDSSLMPPSTQDQGSLSRLRSLPARPSSRGAFEGATRATSSALEVEASAAARYHPSNRDAYYDYGRPSLNNHHTSYWQQQPRPHSTTNYISPSYYAGEDYAGGYYDHYNTPSPGNQGHPYHRQVERYPYNHPLDHGQFQPHGVPNNEGGHLPSSSQYGSYYQEPHSAGNNYDHHRNTYARSTPRDQFNRIHDTNRSTNDQDVNQDVINVDGEDDIQCLDNLAPIPLSNAKTGSGMVTPQDKVD